ncbi:MAG: alpha-glucuronidase [Clostridiales bacterium]|jgi:alpha-glucuronidase|nr:alpha-glucuronidase [Clostridiales bacterium]
MPNAKLNRHTKGYGCWLRYADYISCDNKAATEYEKFFSAIVLKGHGRVIRTAANELVRAAKEMFGTDAPVLPAKPDSTHITLRLDGELLDTLGPEGFEIRVHAGGNEIEIAGADENGVLYGVFELLFGIGLGKSISQAEVSRSRSVEMRMIEHWDNMSGDIERGYAGKSIFFKDNNITTDYDRIRDYARLLASVSVNGISINNVNVHKQETFLITEKYLPQIAELAGIFSDYGIKLFLSINFAAPVEIDGLDTADPLDEGVIRWWEETAGKIYAHIPDFGGFLVKADSENRPGPFTYRRDHSQGANMLARALRPYGGLVIWRCFVYDCHLDWRDRAVDRARAAYDNFKPLDGKFDENVVLQIKNGPMDFQIREPVSPLFGALPKTNVAVEFQITQEYTGQQKHLCYLVPMWKETLDFDTFTKGEGSTVSRVVDGSLFGLKHGGMAGVSNVGDDNNWCGHPLAQANLFGFGRLAWNTALSSEDIARQWVALTFGHNAPIMETLVPMLLDSREIYEMYTAPLGVGWMVKPGFHYGPDVDGYEYSQWGTYHYADRSCIGVDRTQATGTGFTSQYHEPVAGMYENIETCPDELLLFFHHVSYEHVLKSGKTVIAHIYDTHFEGAERAKELLDKWKTLKELVSDDIYDEALRRFEHQVESAAEWRDVINTYFYRKTGIDDIHNRKIYR